MDRSTSVDRSAQQRNGAAAVSATDRFKCAGPCLPVLLAPPRFHNRFGYVLYVCASCAPGAPAGATCCTLPCQGSATPGTLQQPRPGATRARAAGAAPAAARARFGPAGAPARCRRRGTRALCPGAPWFPPPLSASPAGRHPKMESDVMNGFGRDGRRSSDVFSVKCVLLLPFDWCGFWCTCRVIDPVRSPVRIHPSAAPGTSCPPWRARRAAPAARRGRGRACGPCGPSKTLGGPPLARALRAVIGQGRVVGADHGLGCGGGGWGVFTTLAQRTEVWPAHGMNVACACGYA